MSSPGIRHYRIISPDEMPRWVLYEDSAVIAIDKPAGVVCHPSKAGPWSSLSGAVREYFGLPAAHLVTRLDRETSGIVVFARDPETARRLQGAAESRLLRKSYLAVLTGEMNGPVLAEYPLGPAAGPVAAEETVRPDGRPSSTEFTPLARGGGFTLTRAVTLTGRKHQIRAHARHIGQPLAGDKIYGPDPRLFLEFIETGWTRSLAEKLLLPRHALHCHELDLRGAGYDLAFSSPLPADLLDFCAERGIVPPDSALDPRSARINGTGLPADGQMSSGTA